MQLLGVSHWEAKQGRSRTEVLEWVLPQTGPSPPDGPLSSCSSSQLCYCCDWGAGLGVRGFTWDEALLLCLAILESRSWLDLISPFFSSLPHSSLSHSSFWLTAARTRCSVIPAAFFCFVSSQPMCHTHPTPLLYSVSACSPRTKCQAFIRNKQLSSLLWGEMKTEWMQKKDEVRKNVEQGWQQVLNHSRLTLTLNQKIPF